MHFVLTALEVEEVEDLPHERRLHELLQLDLARVLLGERPLEHGAEVRRLVHQHAPVRREPHLCYIN